MYAHMDNSLKVKFSLSQSWIAEKKAVVFGIFEGEEIPCGLGFKKETAEKEMEALFPIFVRVKKHFAHKDFSGTFGEIAVLYPDDTLYKRIILCGLGKKEELNAEKIRVAAAAAIAAAEKLHIHKISFTLFGAPVHSAMERLRFIFEGATLSLYKFDAYKTKPASLTAPKAVISDVEFLLPEIIEEKDIVSWQKQLDKYTIIAEAVYFARNLTNQPASVVTPAFLAQTAEALSTQYAGVSCTVYQKKELAEMGMNGVLAVGAGSDNEPHLIVLEYKNMAVSESVSTVALVGKGVCFDSGGISLKPSENMDEMKMDMAGAAAVMGAFFTAARLALPAHVVAVIPVVENMPSSKSYRPGDIIKTASGKTIEVLNTDAEGRIILADALHYAVSQYKPTHVIDVATLTGACVVALGSHYAALLGNNDALAEMLFASGEKTGEKVWRMPLDEAYKKQIESEIADVKNIGGKGAGTITAAMFLKEFIGDHKSWAHLDIAGTAMLSEKNTYRPKGGSGFGVRLLVEFLENLQNPPRNRPS